MLLTLILHQYVPKTRAFHLKRDQDVFEQIVVVFVHYKSISLDDLYHFFFREKVISCPCFVLSGLNDIFQWYAYCVILSKSSLRFDDDIAGLVIAEKSKCRQQIVLHYNAILVANY